MSDVPPGWYTDPGGARLDRWYDGSAFTDRVRPRGGGKAFLLPTGAPPPPVTQTGVMPGVVPGRPGASGAPGVAVRPDTRSRTPDGVVLAGWWARVGAVVIDELIQVPITLVLALPFLRHLVGVYADLYDDLVRAQQYGAPLPDFRGVESRVAGDVVALVLIALVVSLVYNVGFLSWRQATPGKLALGLRVRRLDRPGPMPVETILVRWLAQFGPGAFRLIPYVSITLLVAAYVLLDRLWALWNGSKMTLHDRAARTVVVLARGDGS